MYFSIHKLEHPRIGIFAIETFMQFVKVISLWKFTHYTGARYKLLYCYMIVL